MLHGVDNGMLAAAPRGVPSRVAASARVATIVTIRYARVERETLEIGLRSRNRAPARDPSYPPKLCSTDPWGRPEIPAEGSARISRPPKGPLLPADLYPAEVLVGALVLLPYCPRP